MHKWVILIGIVLCLPLPIYLIYRNNASVTGEQVALPSPTPDISSQDEQREISDDQVDGSEAPEPTPTKKVVTQITPVPTTGTTETTNTPSSADTDNWIYPSSQIISSQPLQLSSGDDPDVIFDWYVARVEALDLAATTKVRTRSNDTYRYVLSAASNAKTVKVEINRDPGESTATIQVALTEAYL